MKNMNQIRKAVVETAEDDRVIGIPHVMQTSGDKIYIINGRIMSGWSMYFSLTAIRSPENYSQIVDIVYNVPYILAAINMRASLSLGARFDVVEDPGITNNDDMVGFIRTLLFERLHLDGRMLKKISAHLDIYGNSYVHIRRDHKGVPDKLTILQPERLKIFLDPMTTKILFYIYLPPIIGGTVLVPYPYEKPNPNLIQNIALTYPTPIIVPPEDIIHLKQQDYTEYPFGFSLLRACMEPAQARLDYTIVSPIIYKHYSKPIIHWMLDPVGLNAAQVKTQQTAMKGNIENMEPTSDMITTNKWASNAITGVSKGFSAAMDMISDCDTQIFAAMGVPETYFKPRGTTDRMVGEQDKVFIKNMKDRQEYFAEEIKSKLIYPAVRAKFDLQEKDIPRVKIQWRKMIMTDESIEIQNTIALLQSQIIDFPEARRRLALPKNEQEAQEDILKKFTGANTAKMAGQVPATPAPVPLGPAPPAQPTGAQAAPPAVAGLFQDKGDEVDDFLMQKSGESDVIYEARIATRYGKSTNKNPIVEISDDAAIRVSGRAGDVDGIEYTGPQESGERISSRKCPFCKGDMFESQDLKEGENRYRCERHGYI